MTDNILSQMFYNRSTQPAWHGLGINDPADHSAVEALERVSRASGLDHVFGVQKQPLHIEMPGAPGFQETGWYMLVRDPVPGDEQHRIVGTPVTKDFEVINPLDLATMWDRSLVDETGKVVPIETLGLLANGTRMFITVELPGYSIKGDEVKMYLIFDAPINNGVSIGGYTSGVRVVCQNTLLAAISSANQRFTVTHDKGAAEVCARWIGGVYSRSLAAAGLLKEAYEVLATRKATVPAIKWIVENTYRLPPELGLESARARRPLEEREAVRQMEITRINRVREQVMTLIDGQGTALDTKATKGKLFGVYNAVSEFECYGRQGNLRSAVTGLINGDRGQRIRDAFSLSMAADHYDSIDPREVVRVTVGR